MLRLGYVILRSMRWIMPAVYTVVYAYVDRDWDRNTVITLGSRLNPTRQFKHRGDAEAYAERFFLHLKLDQHWIYYGNLTDLSGIKQAWKSQTHQRLYKNGLYYRTGLQRKKWKKHVSVH